MKFPHMRTCAHMVALKMRRNCSIHHWWKTITPRVFQCVRAALGIPRIGANDLLDLMNETCTRKRRELIARANPELTALDHDSYLTARSIFAIRAALRSHTRRPEDV